MPRRGDIYLEFFALGGQVKVSAIDAATGIEVSIFGPLDTTRDELERIVIAKLRRRIERETGAPAYR